jgi:hypothetical protein
VKNQFVLARLKLFGGQERLIRSAIGIGLDGFQQLRFLGVEGPEFDSHSLRGTAVSGVKDMCAEPGRHAKFDGRKQQKRKAAYFPLADFNSLSMASNIFLNSGSV